MLTDLKHYDNPEFYENYSFTQQQYPMHAINMAGNLPAMVQTFSSAAAASVRILRINPALALMAAAVAVIHWKTVSHSVSRNADASVELNKLSRQISNVSRMLQAKENSLEMHTSGAGHKLLRSYDRAVDVYMINMVLRSGVVRRAHRGVL